MSSEPPDAYCCTAVLRSASSLPDTLARGRASVSGSEEALRSTAVQQYASGGSELMALSTVFNSQDPTQLTSHLNSHKNVLDKEAATLARLEASEVMLALQESSF